MATKKIPIQLSTDDLLSKYTEYVLEQEQRPASVFKFCKHIGIEETEFYKHFASFEKIEAYFFVAMHQHSLKLLHQNKDFENYDDANKLLSYYFTFFEMATANRSYILMTLESRKNPMECLVQLKDFRNQFLEFTQSILGGRAMMPDEKLKKIETKVMNEGAWFQFLFTLKFWMNDSSPNFEKTDVMIEKSVRASFDLMDNIPMKSLLDLGKFLWKERPFQ